MLCKSARSSFPFLISLFFILGISPAKATITLEPPDPYTLQGDTIYYAADNLSSTVGFVDTGQNFETFSLTATQGTSQTSEMILLDVTSSETFSGTGTLALSVYATTSGSTKEAVPIGASGVTTGTPTECNSGFCFAENTTGRFYAVPFTEGSTLRIGLYPADICAISTTINGCSSSVMETPVEGTPTKALNLKVVIGFIANETTDTVDEGEAENFEFNIIFQADAPGLSCPDISNFYFPGDQEIIVNPAAVSASAASGAAPVTEIIVVGNLNSDPDTSTSATLLNPIVGRIPSGAGAGTVGGFINTTTGSDNTYHINISARDSAGVIRAFSTIDTECQFDAVRTSEIQGFLNQSNCFIATAAFYSPDGPVMLLRQFRDEFLMSFSWGRGFVDWYYSWSPESAQWLIEHSWARIPVLFFLVPVQVVAWLVLNPVLVLLFISFILLFFLGRRRWVVAVFLLSISAGAESYTEEQKKYLPEKKEEEGSYTERLKEKLGPSDSFDGEYIEVLKETRPKFFQKDDGSAGYTEREKQKLGAPPDNESAIQSVLDGTSELEPYKDKKIRGAGGIKIGASLDRNITAATTAQPFSSVYGSGWDPDITFFFEYQPFHSEWFGNVGIVGSFGFSFFTGNGRFTQTLINEKTGLEFSSTSRTEFRFVTIPLTAGLNYRFNLLRILRPFVFAGGTLIGYVEDRNDGNDGHRGNSRGYILSGGVAIMLDWFDRKSSWDMYDSSGVKHTYITIEYSKQGTFSGPVNFDISGIYAGLTFEY